MVARNRASSAGDFTGRQKAAQAKEQRDALAAREAELSMQNSALSEEEENGIFDGQTGERLNGPDLNVATAVDLEEDYDHPVPPGWERPGIDEPVFTGQESPEQIAPALAARRTFSHPEVVRSAEVVIRVESDIENMTYGMKNGEPNNFNFSEGIAYKVPYDVYEHLNERGLVRQVLRG